MVVNIIFDKWRLMIWNCVCNCKLCMWYRLNVEKIFLEVLFFKFWFFVYVFDYLWLI